MTGRGIICSFSNLQLSGGQEIWTQQSLMWKEVRGPQAGPSAPAPPWQREWVIFTLFGTPALWNCYGQARCNLWLRLQSTRWKVRSLNMESPSRASWPVDLSASEECGRVPYNSLCNADSSLIQVFFFHRHLSLLLSRMLSKQHVSLWPQKRRVLGGGGGGG